MTEVISTFLKPTTFKSAHYLEFVRQHSCFLCGTKYPCHAHHVSLGKNMMGGKPPDTHAIPLCWTCHFQVHNGALGLDTNDAMRTIINLLTEYLTDEREA